MVNVACIPCYHIDGKACTAHRECIARASLSVGCLDSDPIDDSQRAPETRLHHFVQSMCCFRQSIRCLKQQTSHDIIAMVNHVVIHFSHLLAPLVIGSSLRCVFCGRLSRRATSRYSAKAVAVVGAARSRWRCSNYFYAFTG